MSGPVTRGLVVAATALSGVVAGTSLDNRVVQLPAWRRAGSLPWAAHTREILPKGLPWYLTLGFTTAAVNLAATVAVHLDKEASRAASLSSKAAGALVIGHLLASSQAGPYMVKASHTDAPEALGDALEGFARWHGVRTGLDLLTFGAVLWSLVSVHRSAP